MAGNLGCFNAIVAENGAVLYFPESGRHAVLGHAPSARFIDALLQRGIDIAVAIQLSNRCCARDVRPRRDSRARAAADSCVQPRPSMVLPPGIAKSIGLARVLSTLRLSIHNTIGIGDAENDHDLLDACEVGVAVEWGSPALRAVADEVIPGTGPPAVAPFSEVTQQLRLSSKQMGRRRLLLGHQHDGQPAAPRHSRPHGADRRRAGSGKSWLAGLLCEQLILQGYCLCIIDPEGHYRSLERCQGCRHGRRRSSARARELTQALPIPTPAS